MNWVKVGTGIAAYLLVIGIYVAFFAYPVVPAYANAPDYSEVENKTYSTLPYVVYKVYVRGSVTPGILLVATVRTPFVPDSTYSKILRSMESIIENQTKERYDADIDLVLQGTRNATINGHSVVMDDYDVHLRYLNSVPFPGVRPDTIKLYFGAFFCNEKYESIIVAYVCPPVFEDDFSSVMAGVQC
ncbi:MAG: hypothetical protein GXO25_06130 [Euryarchaeota archaeon]|nr:hypothetical protein [Euryarchaeota archaeon]